MLPLDNDVQDIDVDDMNDKLDAGVADAGDGKNRNFVDGHRRNVAMRFGMNLRNISFMVTWNIGSCIYNCACPLIENCSVPVSVQYSTAPFAISLEPLVPAR